MIIKDQARIVRASLLAGAASVTVIALSGCMASPTYGTDKTASAQLIEDMTGMLSLGPKKGPSISYKPRPGLVRPETTAVLPPPQDNVTTASNSAWPESPEQRLARIRKDATENRDNLGYRPNVVIDTQDVVARASVDDSLLSDREKREEFKRRLAESRQGSPNSRKYLSEPPIDYRRPAATAPVDDIGEPEWKKERKARRDSRANSDLF